jgi:hypothetical protein
MEIAATDGDFATVTARLPDLVSELGRLRAAMSDFSVELGREAAERA